MWETCWELLGIVRRQAIPLPVFFSPRLGRNLDALKPAPWRGWRCRFKDGKHGLIANGCEF